MLHQSPLGKPLVESVASILDKKIAVIETEWNNHITALMREAAVKVLLSYGIPSGNIQNLKAPGSFELPLVAKWVLTNPNALMRVDAAICLGCVIRGGTPHFEYVSQAVTQGCTQLALETNKPVIFGVLTVNDEKQAFERIDGSHANKGEEAALTLIKMLMIQNEIFTPKPQ